MRKSNLHGTKVLADFESVFLPGEGRVKLRGQLEAVGTRGLFGATLEQANGGSKLVSATKATTWIEFAAGS
jgi:hypothetical protein